MKTWLGGGGDLKLQANNVFAHCADEKDVSLPLGLGVFVVASEDREGGGRGGQQEETDCDKYFTPLTSLAVTGVSSSSSLKLNFSHSLWFSLFSKRIWFVSEGVGEEDT